MGRITRQTRPACCPGCDRAEALERFAARMDYLRWQYERDITWGREGSGSLPRRRTADDVLAFLRGACRIASHAAFPGHPAAH